MGALLRLQQSGTNRFVVNNLGQCVTGDTLLSAAVGGAGKTALGKITGRTCGSIRLPKATRS